MDFDRQTAAALLDSGAFRISMDPLFTWTSGMKSPVYCDLRALISDIEVREMIVDAFISMMPEDVEVIAGTATAGIPWAAWIADRLKKPMVYVRSSKKAHGMKKRTEGILGKGKNVVLIEDNISTGGSGISALNALREEGETDANLILAINTYGMAKADENYKAANAELRVISNYGVILELAKERGLLDDAQLTMLSDFKVDPSGWADRHGLS